MENETKRYDETAPHAHAAADAGASPPLSEEEEQFERLYCDLERLCVRISRRKFGIREDEMKTIVHDVFISYLANPAVVRGDVRTYLISSVYFASSNYWRSKRYEN